MAWEAVAWERAKETNEAPTRADEDDADSRQSTQVLADEWDRKTKIQCFILVHNTPLIY